MYKAKLEELCQKKNWDSPQYSAMKDGPEHDPRFIASVFINGIFFTSPPSCFTLKQANTEAARSAFHHFVTPQEAEEEFATGIYKNLLQELTMREKLDPPCYRTQMAGQLECPTFHSSVEVGSETFSGKSGHTKKAAEMNAAKVAYTALKEANFSMKQDCNLQTSCQRKRKFSML
ncbi:Double-stranded RNA-binding protein 5 [Linum perenne]